MLTLSSSISNYMWGVIAFISGSGLLILGINSIVKQSLSKSILIIRIIGTVSITVTCYSISLANFLIDKGYDQLSTNFLILSGISALILLITGGVAKFYSNERN